jgi:hypothetical protein
MIVDMAEISTRLPPIRDISVAATVCNREVKMSDTVLNIKRIGHRSQSVTWLAMAGREPCGGKVTFISACAHTQQKKWNFSQARG